MTTFEAVDFYQLDELLSDEERAIRDRVRHWVEERFLPVVATHYRAGTFPPGVASGTCGTESLRASDSWSWLPWLRQHRRRINDAGTGTWR